MSTVHDEGERLFSCSSIDCAFSATGPRRGFVRLDKLREHVKKVHPDSTQMADLAVRRRPRQNGVGQEAEGSSVGKRRRTVLASNSSEPEDSDLGLESEVKRLRQIVEEQGNEIRMLREEHRKQLEWWQKHADDLCKKP